MKKIITLVILMVCMGCGIQRVVPVNNKGVFSIVIDNTVMEIDPGVGGRITALTYQGKNFLTGKDVNADYWGSTLWPSPQKDWGGSVPEELDNKAYTVEVKNDVIKMVSRKDKKFGYVFSKEIYGDRKKKYFSIKYKITNQSDEVRNVAPWEVTRVHTKGLAFYPIGSGERRGNLAGLAEDIDGITWFNYKEDKIPATHNKFFADGSEGWLAQVNNDVILIKKFPDIAADMPAPAESEIEVYTNAGKSYVEIEQQGAYEKLQPGDSLTWEVKWFLRKIPATINREAGNAQLVSFVRKIVK